MGGRASPRQFHWISVKIIDIRAYIPPIACKGLPQRLLCRRCRLPLPHLWLSLAAIVRLHLTRRMIDHIHWRRCCRHRTVSLLESLVLRLLLMWLLEPLVLRLLLTWLLTRSSVSMGPH